MPALVGDPGGGADVLVARATPPGASAVAIVRLSGPPGRTIARRPERWRPGSPLPPSRGGPTARASSTRRAQRWTTGSSSGSRPRPRRRERRSSSCTRTVRRPSWRRSSRRPSRAGRGGPGPGNSRAGRWRTARWTWRGPKGSVGWPPPRPGARRGGRSVSCGEICPGESIRRGKSFWRGWSSWRRDSTSPRTSTGRGRTRRCRGSRRSGRRCSTWAAKWGPAGRGRGLPTVVILGAPNAGKSTLFNALLGEDRVLVTELPGTTRDAVAEVVELGGERVRLVDTAGVRETAERVERLGVEAALRAAEGADLVLLAREPGGPGLEGGALAEGVPLLEDRDEGGSRRWGPGVGGCGSARGPGKGWSRSGARSRRGSRPEERRASSARFPASARRSCAPRRRSRASGPECRAEIAAGAVRGALHALGEITGETATEELLDRIFSTFCVGK
jgi:hypothetical protein